jgi:two-component system cell cycle response regulator
MRETIIIMVTALHELGDMERAVESGCDDFVSKPVNKVELLTRVRGLMSLRLLKKKLASFLADNERA